MPVAGGRLLSILGVAYVHVVPPEGGDLYMTRFGIQFRDELRIDNWYEREWFVAKRERLEGTSAVFRVPTKAVRGRSIDLVVKNCRFGEDVPVDTRTVEDALNAEFNSPWEEFSLVMEMREGAWGARGFALCTQRPLAIYVPPESMQLWQSGRSRDRVERLQARNPGIALDILRQYKLVYEWIPGMNVIELMQAVNTERQTLAAAATAYNARVTEDLESKGWIVADMKPQHIIINESDARTVLDESSLVPDPSAKARDMLASLIATHTYAVIDYELLSRTSEHESDSRSQRRKDYLDALQHRYDNNELPQNLQRETLVGVPYVCGNVESTGGRLWVVGNNPQLFDFFLPERWRKTALWRLSSEVELSYTVTKDGVHLLWTPSRAGEAVNSADGRVRHYGNPFMVAAVLRLLAQRGISVVAPRAIYRTGTARLSPVEDHTEFAKELRAQRTTGEVALREDRNYLMTFGFYAWVGEGKVTKKPPPPPRPVGLALAARQGLVPEEDALRVCRRIQREVEEVGFDASALTPDDLLAELADDDRLLRDESGELSVRLHNVELLVPRGALEDLELHSSPFAAR